MAVSLKKKSGEETKKANSDIYEMVLRVMLGLLVNFIGGRLRKKRELKKERQKAQRQAGKLAARGKEVPEELKKEAVSGLSRREKKKLAKKGKKKAAKKAGKDKKKGKKKKVFLLLLIVVGIVLAARARSK